MCFLEKVSLGQDFSPISPLFLHSNPIHFIFTSTPMEVEWKWSGLEVEWIGKENEVDWVGVEERRGDW